MAQSRFVESFPPSARRAFEYAVAQLQRGATLHESRLHAMVDAVDHVGRGDVSGARAKGVFGVADSVHDVKVQLRCG